MTKEEFDNILVFLGRTQLTGGEAPMFLRCVQSLKNLYERSVAPVVKKSSKTKDKNITSEQT